MLPMLASFEADTIPMVSHDQKHVTHDFDHLNIRNAMAPMMQLVSCDANANGIT